MGSSSSRPTYTKVITARSSISLPDDTMTIERIFSTAGRNVASSLSSLPLETAMDSRYSAAIGFSLMSLHEDIADLTIDIFKSAYVCILSDIARIERFVSSEEDIFRLIRMEAIFESNQGKLLAFSDEDGTFCLVEKVGNGDIPQDAMFGAPYSSFLNYIGVFFMGLLREMLRSLDDDPVRRELSAELSQYIWPLDQDAIHVQFRSLVPYFHLGYSRLKVVFSNNEGDDNGEFCLTACSDKTVKWLPQSKPRNGNHIWTVQLFDPTYEKREVHLGQRLRRLRDIGQNNYVNVVNNNNFGGNSNMLGSQIIEAINFRSEINLNVPKANLQRRE